MAETPILRATRRALATLPVGITRVWLRRLLLANLVGQVGIVLTGGIVRLTGSGLGCPTFPECVEGSYLPVVTQPQGIHKYIEFGNRMLTFVVTVLAVAALLAVLRQVRSGVGGRRLLLLGAVPFVGVMAQALIGGVTVLTGLNPGVVAVHFMVSMGLIAGSTVLLLIAVPPLEPDTGRPVEVPAARRLAVAVGVVATAVLTLGTLVTGSGPHSGDAADPNRFSFDIPLVTRTHSALVWLFVGLVVALLVTLRLRGAGRRPIRRATILVAVTLGQGVIGYLQYALGVPVALVAIHMLGAALFVIATTATVHAVFDADRSARAAAPADQFGPLLGEDQADQPLPVQG